MTAPRNWLVRLSLLAAGVASASGLAAAATAAVPTEARWTGKDDPNTDFGLIVARLNAQTGMSLKTSDFKLTEDRPLAFGEHYRRYDEILSDISVNGMSVRVWSDESGRAPAAIQVEARVVVPAAVAPGVTELESAPALATHDTSWTTAAAKTVVAASEDRQVRSLKGVNTWEGGRLVRIVTIKAHRGQHVLRFDLVGKTLLSQAYQPYADADLSTKSVGEYSLPALVYPIYERYNGELLERTNVSLEHIQRSVQRPAADIFAPLADLHLLYSKIDPRGDTPEGRAQGFWTTRWLASEAARLKADIPMTPNLPTSDGGALLQGKYATINIYPEVFAAHPEIKLEKKFSSQMLTTYKDLGNDDYEVVPHGAYYGKPLMSRDDALNRDASVSATNDPAFYLDAGFDEVQVYAGINQLFNSLQPMGFVDPDLGERPFNAFLYDTDIAMQNNAYYDNDTINFTTYTPGEENAARDNTTIWHELGHGVMDRLMGTELQLADTGGLSEGMADFVAALVLRATNADKPFPGKDDMRIINGTGFFLTNEVHDDGEAYGGTMKVILDKAIEKYGEVGLQMVGDTVLEAMRLSRDNPGLTAQIWFDHLLFADERGRDGMRDPGALNEVIHAALDARNFADESHREQFVFTHNGTAINSGTAGSRGNEIRLELAADATSTQNVEVTLKDGSAVAFKYPVTVRVVYNSGPLQGAIDWVGEDTEPTLFTITGPDQPLTIPLTVNGKCDAINRDDNTCSDFAYVQIVNNGETRPVAKKRFYLRIKTL